MATTEADILDGMQSDNANIRLDSVMIAASIGPSCSTDIVAGLKNVIETEPSRESGEIGTSIITQAVCALGVIGDGSDAITSAMSATESYLAGLLTDPPVSNSPGTDYSVDGYDADGYWDISETPTTTTLNSPEVLAGTLAITIDSLSALTSGQSVSQSTVSTALTAALDSAAALATFGVSSIDDCPISITTMAITPALTLADLAMADIGSDASDDQCTEVNTIKSLVETVIDCDCFPKVILNREIEELTLEQVPCPTGPQGPTAPPPPVDDPGGSDGSGSSTPPSGSGNMAPETEPNCPPSALSNNITIFESTVVDSQGNVVVSFGETGATGNPVVLLWDFGDGATAVGVTASHTYTEPGYYQVTVETLDDASGLSSITTCGLNVITPTIVIPPYLPTGPVPVTVTTPLPVVIVIDEEEYDFPTGTSTVYVTGPCVSIPQLMAAEYCVEYYSPLVATMVTDGVVCEDVDKYFNLVIAGGIEPYSIKWYINDELQEDYNDQVEMVKAFKAGSYNVKAVIMDTAENDLEITPDEEVAIYGPVVGYISDIIKNYRDDGLPIGDTVDYYACVFGFGDPNMYGYHWDFGDGTTADIPPGSTGNIPIPHPYDKPGTYYVALQVVDITGCTSTITSDPVYVYGRPEIRIKYKLDPTCYGRVEYTLYTVLGKSPYTVKLYYGDGRSNNFTTPGGDLVDKHEYRANGIYAVTATVADSLGITNEAVIKVDIKNSFWDNSIKR